MTHANQAPQGRETSTNQKNITLGEIQSTVRELRDIEPKVLPIWQSADPIEKRKYLSLSGTFSDRVRQLTAEAPAAASQIIDTLMSSEDPADRIAGVRTLYTHQATRAYDAPDEVRSDVVRWHQALNDPDASCREQATQAAWALADEPYLAFRPLYDLMVARQQAESTQAT